MDSLNDWNNYRLLKTADPDAAERGRLLAAGFIASDPEARKRVEDRYGIELCRQMYPECYQSGFSRLLERVRKAIPW